MATTWNVGSDQACKTINEALSLASDGDTIIVNAGDYTDEVLSRLIKALRSRLPILQPLPLMLLIRRSLTIL